MEPKEKGGKIFLWNQVTGNEAIVCMEHADGKVFGELFNSEMKILEHFLRVQLAEDVSIDIVDQGGHGLSCTE